MKTITGVLFLLLASPSHAAWETVSCSNSDGSVNWVNHPNESFVNLKYANFVEGTLTLELNLLNMKLSNKVVIDQKSIEDCSFKSGKEVFAGKVIITPSDMNPDILIGQFPLNQIETEVICTKLTKHEQRCAI